MARALDRFHAPAEHRSEHDQLGAALRNRQLQTARSNTSSSTRRAATAFTACSNRKPKGYASARARLPARRPKIGFRSGSVITTPELGPPGAPRTSHPNYFLSHFCQRLNLFFDPALLIVQHHKI